MVYSFPIVSSISRCVKESKCPAGNVVPSWLPSMDGVCVAAQNMYPSVVSYRKLDENSRVKLCQYCRSCQATAQSLIFVIVLAKVTAQSLIFVTVLAKVTAQSLIFVTVLAKVTVKSLIFVAVLAKATVKSFIFLTVLAKATVKSFIFIIVLANITVKSLIFDGFLEKRGKSVPGYRYF